MDSDSIDITGIAKELSEAIEDSVSVTRKQLVALEKDVFDLPNGFSPSDHLREILKQLTELPDEQRGQLRRLMAHRIRRIIDAADQAKERLKRTREQQRHL